MVVVEPGQQRAPGPVDLVGAGGGTSSAGPDVGDERPVDQDVDGAALDLDVARTSHPLGHPQSSTSAPRAAAPGHLAQGHVEDDARRRRRTAPATSAAATMPGQGDRPLRRRRRPGCGRRSQPHEPARGGAVVAEAHPVATTGQCGRRR